jgi:ubiquinone/menaquinone biosynthesis C-methylase UbiE
MRKIYQHNWFGIDFSDLSELSRGKLPSARFYEDFYRSFFDKYTSYSDLDDSYRKDKECKANFIADRVKNRPKCLSFGCGIGYIEYLLSIGIQDLQLYIVDNPIATKWIEKFIDKKYVNADLRKIDQSDFDLIYLVLVDYAFTDQDLVNLLQELKRYLNSGGSIMVINMEKNYSTFERIDPLIKDLLKDVLSILGLYDRGQFWGYLRSPQEIENLFRKAGFISQIRQTMVSTNIQGCNFSCTEAFLS